MVQPQFQQQTFASADQNTLPAVGGLLLVSAGAAVAAGRAVLISCTVTGTITVNFVDGTTITFTLPVGLVQLNYSITGYTIGTATATVFNLY